MLEYDYIDTDEKLRLAAEFWTDEIAIDLECENNLHHYGTFISLVQISTRERNWILDVLKVKNPKELITILHNPKIQKVFHDVSFDLRILFNQFNCKPKNIFDTLIAALFLNKENLGLGSLFEEYFDLKKEKKFQRVDWTKRPLSKEMLEYATKDSAYLLELRDILTKELIKMERLEWVTQENKHLEEIDFTFNEQEYTGVSGVKSMNPEERGRFKVLFEQRNKIAEEIDYPPYKIIRNAQLLAFARNPPYSVNSWKQLRGIHPLVKKRAELFYNAVKNASEDVLERPVMKKFTIQQRNQVKKITELRNQIAEKLQLKPHLLLTTDELRQVVIQKTISFLRQWKQEVLEGKIDFLK